MAFLTVAEPIMSCTSALLISLNTVARRRDILVPDHTIPISGYPHASPAILGRPPAPREPPPTGPSIGWREPRADLDIDLRFRLRLWRGRCHQSFHRK